MCACPQMCSLWGLKYPFRNIDGGMFKTRVDTNFCHKANNNMGTFFLKSSMFRNMDRCPRCYVEKLQGQPESVSSYTAFSEARYTYSNS